LADVERLLQALNRLVDAGHTVLLIEHHLDVIKTADHVIDLGPDGGHAGGRVVATGTPEEIAACEASHTGRFLKGRG
jgi:excinuclease ABC subunit A